MNADGTVVCEPLEDPRFLAGWTRQDNTTGFGLSCTLGEILLSGILEWTPPGTMVADGRLIAITSNEPLYSLLGTVYGGDGITTFALPDLRDLSPYGTSYAICVAGAWPGEPE